MPVVEMQKLQNTPFTPVLREEFFQCKFYNLPPYPHLLPLPWPLSVCVPAGHGHIDCLRDLLDALDTPMAVDITDNVGL